MSMRDLSPDLAARLAPGDDHYRAYVGPPDEYDLMGGTQFALLLELGLRRTTDCSTSAAAPCARADF